MINTADVWRSLSAGGRLFLIAGPCVVESERLCLEIAATLKQLGHKLGITCVFKASYDKANRTSGKSFRGLGKEEGLQILGKVRDRLHLPVLTDVHTEMDVERVGEVVDIIQIPAFLCRQTDLIRAAVRTGKIVNIKKGQFLSPPEMEHVVHKTGSAEKQMIMVTERGTTFGYNNLVVDMRSLPIMRRFGFPVVFDATHSVQLPGAGGDKSSGNREFVPALARAAIAAGADGVFLETHPSPAHALSDGPNMIALSDLPDLVSVLVKLHALVAPTVARELAA